MKYILIPVFLLVIQYHSHGQLPDCVKERCDSILISELGDEIFQSCIEFTAYKINKPLNEQIENPCLAQSNHRYTVDYKFSFPSEEKAFFTLGFVCDGYSGSMRIQSKYFYRHNQSDLPFGFKDMGLNIVAYHKIAGKASKEMSKYNDDKEPKRWDEAVLAINQNKIYWVFSHREPYRDPSGFGDEAMIVKTVWVDPYSGKIIDSESRRH